MTLEITEAMNRAKIGKVPGLDGLLSRFYNIFEDQLLLLLLQLLWSCKGVSYTKWGKPLNVLSYCKIFVAVSLNISLI